MYLCIGYYIGGGLGGTRRGGPDINVKISGREDPDRERFRDSDDGVRRRDRRDRSKDREIDGGRRRDRSRERKPERVDRRRSRDRSDRERNERDKKDPESRKRSRRDEDKDKDKSRKRSKSHERKRHRSKSRDKDKKRDRKDKDRGYVPPAIIAFLKPGDSCRPSRVVVAHELVLKSSKIKPNEDLLAPAVEIQVSVSPVR